MSGHPAPAHATLKYRPAIDGLRALAILSVFFFHLNRRWLPGGFVGVDVFFVISGYLITSLLLKDRERGSLSLSTFYQRRIARIFPVFFVAGFATLAVAGLVYLPQDFASAGATFVAASLSVANLKFMLQGNYFTLSPDAQPFLHYWSLSVEEQFYMVFPLLLVVTRRWPRGRLRVLFGILWVASFAACLGVTWWRPSWAFYLLPTRTWELLTGSLLALHALEPRTDSPGWTDRYLPWLGLAAIAVSFVIVPEDHTFPGAWALLPVLGTAAVIRPSPFGDGKVERLLASGVLVLIGQMSYSLYLWHWPVFSLVDYQMYRSSEAARLALKVLITVPLSYLSFRFIEGPARAYLSASGRLRPALAFLALALVIAVPTGIRVRNRNYVDASIDTVAAGGVRFPSSGPAPKVMLMGDSTGSMYGTALRDVCAELPCDLSVISVAAGDPLPSMDGRPGDLWAASLAAVKERRPDVLFVSCAWTGKLSSGGERLRHALRELEPLVGQVILLEQPPTLPRSASRASIRRGTSGPFREDPKDFDARQKANALLHETGCSRCASVKTSASLTTVDGSIRFVDGRGREVFQDAGHLSHYGAELVAPDLAKAIRPFIKVRDAASPATGSRSSG